jgi:hypothetical protein
MGIYGTPDYDLLQRCFLSVVFELVFLTKIPSSAKKNYSFLKQNCIRCRDVSYCSRDCQKADWVNHECGFEGQEGNSNL